MPREPLVTANEVAEYLQCSASTIRRLAARGKIPHYRLGKIVRFRRSEVDAWLVLYRHGEVPAAPPKGTVDPSQLSLFAGPAK